MEVREGLPPRAITNLDFLLLPNPNVFYLESEVNELPIVRPEGLLATLASLRYIVVREQQLSRRCLQKSRHRLQGLQ